MTFEYPVTRQDHTAFVNCHGVEIPDPYRWLVDEDDYKEVAAYYNAQNEITDSYLETNGKMEEFINDRLTKLIVGTDFELPERYGDNYYYIQREPKLFDPERIYYVQNVFENERKVFFAPTKLFPDRIYSVRGQFSVDGSTLAYKVTIPTIGITSHTAETYFMCTTTKKTYLDYIYVDVKSFSSWTHDNLGIFYLRTETLSTPEGSEAEPLFHYKIYYHRIRTPQDEDVLVIEFPDSENCEINAAVSDCGKWLLVRKIRSSKYISIYVAVIEENIQGKFNLTQIVCEEHDVKYKYVANDGTKAIFMTNKLAPNNKLVAIDLLNFRKDNWTVKLPEDAHKYLMGVRPVDNDKFVTWYRYSAVEDILQLHDLSSGELIKIIPLGIGRIINISGNRKYSEIWFTFTSFITPRTLYKFDIREDEIPKVKRELPLENYNPSSYEINKVSYTSKDNTKLIMYIVMKKGAKLDGSMPALLKGENVFSLREMRYSEFPPSDIFFIDNLKGVVALADIRGHTVCSENWTNEESPHMKQISFDDFQSAAEFLIDNGYTSKEKLTISKDYCGSILVSACLTQRPDLYGAAIVNCEESDTLRTDLKESFSGDVKDMEYFPLNNIAPPNDGGQYPATFVHVHDWHFRKTHAIKFIVTLQNKIGRLPQQKKPLLGFFTSCDASAMILIFIIKSLGLKFEFSSE